MATFVSDDDDDDAPLALAQLRHRLTAATYAWLLGESEESSQQQGSEISDDDDDDDDETAAMARNLFQRDDEEEEEYYPRVHEWSSSAGNPDGIGGYYLYDQHDGGAADGEDAPPGVVEADDVGIINHADDEDDAGIVRVQYILSDAPGGHGDDLWAASRHVSNLLADPTQCRRLLLLRDDENLLVGQEFAATCPTDRTSTTTEQTQQPPPQRPPQHHPLHGKRLVELGAGGGLPSWTALHCGARGVVCTDQPIPDRIRALAESAERNARAMMELEEEDDNSSISGRRPALPAQNRNAAAAAAQVKVCPYSWGSPVHEVLHALQEDDHAGAPSSISSTCSTSEFVEDVDDDLRFDIVVAADCIYMPGLHEQLLQSIQRLMKQKSGVALLPFALHGNTADENVWAIVPRAADFGFSVEVLEPRQLTPQSGTMDRKRGLVHMLRLTNNDDKSNAILEG